MGNKISLSPIRTVKVLTNNNNIYERVLLKKEVYVNGNRIVRGMLITQKDEQILIDNNFISKAKIV